MTHLRFAWVIAIIMIGIVAPNGVAARSLEQRGTISGQVVGYRLAGIEPDGDPLNQVVLQTRFSSGGLTPQVNLIVSSYLENFKPDTTPLLPDLLHPRRTARNLGGFLQGKVLVTDDAGDVLYRGSFLAEAFLDNSNHAVMHFDGLNAAQGHSGDLRGTFSLHRDGSLHGVMSGSISLSTAARRQILHHRGATMKPIRQIINLVTVRPAPMMGKATTGSRTAPLKTGYGTSPTHNTSGTRTVRRLSPWTVAAALGALFSFGMAGFLFWSQRREDGKTAPGV